MWSSDTCIEMLLIFSLKEVDEKFQSGAILPREKVMIKCSLPQWRSPAKRELWTGRWAQLARSGCPVSLSIPSTSRKGLYSLPAFAGDCPRDPLHWGWPGNLDQFLASPQVQAI